MHSSTLEVSRAASEEERQKMQEQFDRNEAVPLTEESANKFESMSYESKAALFRKNSFRNKPCICGSGKKFKKCCRSKLVQPATYRAITET